MANKQNTQFAIIKNTIILLAVFALITVLAVFLFKQCSGENSHAGNANDSYSAGSLKQGNVPVKVYDVLEYIKANGKAKKNYVGGRTFGNREKILPKVDENGKKIKYQEWDVNRKIQGKNRGAERIVTGSDGRSWYTSDHYKSFTEIK